MNTKNLSSIPNNGNIIVGGKCLRPIKFRVWDGYKIINAYDLNQFVFSEDCKSWEAIGKDTLHEYVSLDSKECQVDLGNAVIMQFTGVKDVDGIEIYEGDIVIPTKFKDIPNTVEYIQHGFYRVKKHGAKVYLNTLGTCNLKVIGNIYKNPELLG